MIAYFTSLLGLMGKASALCRVGCLNVAGRAFGRSGRGCGWAASVGRRRGWGALFKVGGALGLAGAVQAQTGTIPVLPATPSSYSVVLPAHFSVPVMAQQDNTPSTNPVTDAGATLGRVLFYDKRLSINDTVSCSSCHRRENGFSDPRKVSLGFAGGAGDRNAMGLTNARWYERRAFFWDERAATLEVQVLRPIQDPVEMGMTTAALVTKLEGTSYYAGLFSAAFGSPGITVDRVSRALAQFIRSIVSVSSKYDQGVPLNFSNFTAEEALGRQLFLGQVGRATCATCHGTDSFTPTQRINNNGLENPYLDKGVGALTGLAQDEGLFKVPTLRNIELTAPYMHDGRFSTLEQVVEFYNSGVVDHPNLSPPLRSPPPVPGPLRLNFTIAQKTALVAFLKTLTDRTVVEAVRFSDPFPAEVAPQITQQPVAQIVSVGARVVLAVVATGVPSPSFQWFKNGVVREGEIAANLTLAAAAMTDAGTYSVAVTNRVGSATSSPATVQVNAVVVAAPVITTAPQSQAVPLGAPVMLSVATSASGVSYEWRKDGKGLAGFSGSSYLIPNFGTNDMGSYTVVVTNSGGSTQSAPAVLVVLPGGFVATHGLNVLGAGPSGTISVTNTLEYPGAITGLGWSVLLPAGWSFSSDAGNVGQTPPAVGRTDLIEWAWSGVASSPMSFTYTLNVPVGDTGEKTLVALCYLRGVPGTTGELPVLVKPDPLKINLGAFHSADTDRNGRISLVELTRVIELFNTRNGTARTGSYGVATGSSEDGFSPDQARSVNTVVSLARYHSADGTRAGSLNLAKLTRVIELYNSRSGVARTGQYHGLRSGEAASEDGFNPGP